MDCRLYVVRIEGYDGEDTGLETWTVSRAACGACRHALEQHARGERCPCCRRGFYSPIQPSPLFAIIEIKSGRATIIDNGYRTREEALAAWPEAT